MGHDYKRLEPASVDLRGEIGEHSPVKSNHEAPQRAASLGDFMRVHHCWPLGLALALVASLPAHAQDDASAAPAAAAEAAPADAADTTPAADAPAADATASDAAATPAADASADASSSADTSTTSDSSGSDSAASSGSDAAAAREPLYLYGGVDYAFLTASLSKDSLKTALGGADSYDSNFYRTRVGVRLLPFISVEGQYGIKASSSGSDKADTQQMYGAYLVPTGVLFDLIEVSAPVGYSHVELQNSNGKAKFDAASFGLNVEIPVYVSSNPHIPDVRVGGGGTVYYAGTDARVYGFQAGVRLDFKL